MPLLRPLALAATARALGVPAAAAEDVRPASEPLSLHLDALAGRG